MNMIDAIAEMKALRISKEIDDKMREMWINRLDKNKYHVDVQESSNWVDTYTVYEKVFVWKFYIDTN